VSRASTLWRIAAAGAGLLVAIGIGAVVPGTIERYDPVPGAAARAPTWVQPCMVTPPREDRLLLSRCSRVRGRVLFVRSESAGREAPETHFALTARLHLFVVKLDPDMPTPDLGATVAVVGPLVRARNGLREIEARRLTRG
jgi:hypothetical protein